MDVFSEREVPTQQEHLYSGEMLQDMSGGTNVHKQLFHLAPFNKMSIDGRGTAGQ
ncbi:MAG TPA: hypothetical protein V6C89_16295 [Drouetiella sp.]|jgi:hypothetical protein